MRITVSLALVVDLVANGMSSDEIIREYPDLETEDIREALSDASALANEEVPHSRARGLKLLADKGISMASVCPLREAGEEVAHLREQGPGHGQGSSSLAARPTDPKKSNTPASPII